MGRTKGSKNKAKDTAPLQFTSTQRSTRSQRYSIDNNSSDEESDVEMTPLQTLKASIEGTLKQISADIKHVTNNLRSVEKDFESAVELLTQRIEDLEAKDKLYSEKIQKLEKKVERLEKINKEQADAINVQERFSRRSNVRIVGYPENEGENCIDIIKSVFSRLDIPDVKIERAHRDGKRYPTRPRHILCKLSFCADKIAALKSQRQKLANESYFVTDDLTKIDLNEKRKWSQQVSQLYERGTKLRFSAGKWRDGAGKPYSFGNIDES